MASKYQDVIDRLNDKRSKEKPKSKREKYLSGSQYSDVYRKLGAIGTDNRTLPGEDEQKEKNLFGNSTYESRMNAFNSAEEREREKEQEKLELLKRIEDVKEDIDFKKYGMSSRFSPGYNKINDNPPVATENAENTKEKDNDFLNTLKYIVERADISSDSGFQNLMAFIKGVGNEVDRTAKGALEEALPILFGGGYKSDDRAERKESQLNNDGFISAYEELAKNDNSAERLSELNKKYPNQADSKATQIASDVAGSIANMIPSLLVSTVPVVGPVAGATVMGASSAPSAYVDARNEGAPKDKALKFSNLEFVNQGIGDMILGGIGGYGKGIASSVADTVSNGAFSRMTKRAMGKLARTPIGKSLVKYASNALGEGAEEMAQSLITTANARATYSPDEKVDWKSVAYEGLVGSLMAGVLDAPSIPFNYKVYKQDADVVKDFARAASGVQNESEITLVNEYGNFIIDQMEEVKENGTDEEKERADFITGEISKIISQTNDIGDFVVEANNNIQSAIENAENAPQSQIVENAAEIVDTVASSIPPDENAVNATIDIIHDKIDEQQEIIETSEDKSEKLEAEIEKETLKQIDETIRNNRDEIEATREHPEEESNGVVSAGNPAERAKESDINEEEPQSGSETAQEAAGSRTENENVTAEQIHSDDSNASKNDQNDATNEANKTSENAQKSTKKYTLYHSQAFHTKTGETFEVFKIKSGKKLLEKDYKKLKEKFKSIGGYWSPFAKGFAVPKENLEKVSEFADIIEGDTETQETKAESTPNVQENVPAAESVKESPVVSEPKEEPVEEIKQNEENTTAPEENAESPTENTAENDEVKPEESAKENIENKENAPKKYTLYHSQTTNKNTDEKIEILKIKSDTELSDEEYKDLKNKIKSIDGHWSPFVEGFIVPKENIEKVSKFANVIEINVENKEQKEEPTEEPEDQPIEEASENNVDDSGKDEDYSLDLTEEEKEYLKDIGVKPPKILHNGKTKYGETVIDLIENHDHESSIDEFRRDGKTYLEIYLTYHSSEFNKRFGYGVEPSLNFLIEYTRKVFDKYIPKDWLDQISDLVKRNSGNGVFAVFESNLFELRSGTETGSFVIRCTIPKGVSFNEALAESVKEGEYDKSVEDRKLGIPYTKETYDESFFSDKKKAKYYNNQKEIVGLSKKVNFLSKSPFDDLYLVRFSSSHKKGDYIFNDVKNSFGGILTDYAIEKIYKSWHFDYVYKELRPVYEAYIQKDHIIPEFLAAVESKESSEPVISHDSVPSFVKSKLEAGEKIDKKDMYPIADKTFGGTRAEGKYTEKDLTDSMELGVNEYIMSVVPDEEYFNSGSVDDAKKSLDFIEDKIMDKIPSETHRDAEQKELEQYSTPPTIAYIAAWAANINENDIALEPSAGIGGIASFVKSFGAKTYVNEISERRLSLIKQLPFDGFSDKDAEVLNREFLGDENLKGFSPSVVVMNPPFSQSVLTGKKGSEATMLHIDSALNMLSKGGRLVAVVGKGFSLENQRLSNWWNETKKTCTVRANIEIDGQNYRKYGTTFGVRIIVIDKNGPHSGDTVTGQVKDLKELPALLEGVRNERTRTEGKEPDAVSENRGNKRELSVGSGGKSGGTNRDVPESSGSSESVSGTRNTAGKNTGGKSETGTDAGVHADNVNLDDGQQGKSDESVQTSGGNGGRADTRTGDSENTQKQDQQSAENTENRSDSVGEPGNEPGTVTEASKEESSKEEAKESEMAKPETVGKIKKKDKKASKFDNGVYADYKTADLTVKGAKKHPAKLVESSAMSAVPSPVLTYVPKIEQKLIDDGELSDVQLESISYAGQSHEKILPDGKRRGFFIGDGTGVGKGRQIAGIIRDNFNQGRKKAVWISEKAGLVEDARRDWVDLGGKPDDIISLDEINKKDLNKYRIPDNHILFVPYSSMAGKAIKKRPEPVVDVIERWLSDRGGDLEPVSNEEKAKFDGVIAYDESHNMGHLFKTKGSDPAKKAIYSNKLQDDMPNARVVYVSATGATDIHNLAYASRLGLWGTKTSFSDAQDFISKIGAAGIAAMELVARDMKAMGLYLARSISYDGVMYETLNHTLNSDEVAWYNTAAELWVNILKEFDAAAERSAKTDEKAKKQLSSLRAQFFGRMQLFFNQVITSIAMPSVIEDIRKQRKDGKSCVVQIVNTMEAATKRALADKKDIGEDDDLDDLDITPKELMRGYVRDCFPTYTLVQNKDGEWENAEYLEDNANMKAYLLGIIDEITLPDPPLDLLLKTFGKDYVAEVTGRTTRVVDHVNEKGELKYVTERRTPKDANIAETKDFQDGKKHILVFSNAGSTGVSFHADKRAKNQEQRVLYVLQPGWRADTAVQGFGRVHRSNQVSAPIYKLVTVDVKGQKRFITSIARRLNQLGAITKGQRETGSGIFSDDDNLESGLSIDAVAILYDNLAKGEYDTLYGEGFGEKVISDMGLEEKLYDKYGQFNKNAPEVRDVKTFLNRILVLNVETQNEVFGEFEKLRNYMYQKAEEEGTLEKGMENVKADGVDIKQETVIHTDEETGAETKYIEAVIRNKAVPINSVADAKMIHKGHEDDFVGVYDFGEYDFGEGKGGVGVVIKLNSVIDEKGKIQKRYKIIWPNKGKESSCSEQTLREAKKIETTKQDAAWDEAKKKIPKYNKSTLHMITGSLLPVWDNLPENGNMRAKRIIAEDGTQYLGRIISPKDIDETLRRFGKSVEEKKQDNHKYSGKELYDAIMDANRKVIVKPPMSKGHITIKSVTVSGEKRIEVTGPNVFLFKKFVDGIFLDESNSEQRFFIPVGENGPDVLQKIADKYGIVSVEDKSQPEQDGFYSIAPGDGRWGTGGKDASVKSVTQLVKEAKRIFGISINTGKVGRKDALGIYKTHAGTIRTRNYGDIPTIGHELGHYFDSKYSLNKYSEVEEITDFFRSQLLADGYTEELIPFESVAEYFRYYLQDKDETEIKFPQFTELLYTELSKDDMKRLSEYAAMTNDYHAADLERRADAAVHTRVKDNSFASRAQFQLDAFMRSPREYIGAIARKANQFLSNDDLYSLKPFGNAYNLAYLEKAADSVVEGRLLYGFTDNEGRRIGDSLADILSEGGIDDTNRLEFDKYLIACRALDQFAAKKKYPKSEIGTLVYADEELQNEETTVKRVQKYELENPTFHDAAQGIYEYNENLLSLAVQSGLISLELKNKLTKMYPHYVPLQNVRDTLTEDHPGKAKSGYGNQKSPLKRFYGSTNDKYSPIESIALNTELYTKAAMRNNVMAEFAKIIDMSQGMGWAAEKITPDKYLDKISSDEVIEKIEKALSGNIKSSDDIAKVDEFVDYISGYIGKYVTQWKISPNQKTNIVSAMIYGKKSYYEVHDKDVLESLLSLDRASENIVAHAMGGATALFKTLTTGMNPVFGVTNAMRDIVSGYISSTTENNPFKYVMDYFAAFREAFERSDGFMEYLSNGGGYSDAISRDPSRLARAEREIVKTSNRYKENMQNISHILPDLINAGESASRYAEYKRAREAGLSALRAIRMSQEITVNFSRGNKVTKEIDKFVPYFNASINSTVHMIDVLFKGKPKEKKAAWAKFIGVNTVLAFMALAWRALSPYLFNEDDDEVEKSYEQLSSYNKNAYWSLYMGDGKFARVAKPRDMTVISTVIERMVERYAFDDKTALYDLGGYVIDSLCPPVDVMVVGTALDIARNETFTGAPIVPGYMEGLDSKLQYNDKTSVPAIKIGSLLGVSPMQVDYILKDTTGIVGQLITNLARSDGEMSFGFANKLIVDGVYSNGATNIFFEQKEEYDKYAKSYKSTEGKDKKYSVADVYGSEKYGKIKSVYSDLNSRMNESQNNDIKRDMKKRMNDLCHSVNTTNPNDIDLAVINLAEETGTNVAEIAPFISVPDKITIQRRNQKAEFKLTFDEILEYFSESQVVLTEWYSRIIESGYSEEIQVAAMKEVKKQIAREMRERWEGIKINQVKN